MPNSLIKSRHRVVLADDDPVFCELFENALLVQQPKCRFEAVPSGEDLLRLMSSGTDLPDLVLLDLNLPYKHGITILSEVKAAPGTSHVPIVVLTAGSAPGTIEKIYDLNASGYILKPTSRAELEDMIQKLVDYWFYTVRTPSSVK